MISKKFQIEYDKLNPKQKEAVEAVEGPVMVIAGPGTGKTQIIAMRIANILLKTQVNASNILCLTFTNSGTYAMRKRLLDIIGKSSYLVTVNTFHAFCNEVILTFPEKFITARYLNQLTDLEQILIIQNILDKNDYKLIKPFKSPYYYQKAILDTIHKLKQENISADDSSKIIKNDTKAIGHDNRELSAKDKAQLASLAKCLEVAEVYKKYQKRLSDDGKYDYADMILFVIDALKKDADILSHYQEKYQYILVDEYQDTNTAQNDIVKLLGGFYDNPNIFAVGDDEQSIYRFQGASLENILNFKTNYPQAQIIILEKNYRSGQNILDVSRSLIQNNHQQIENVLKVKKSLKSARDITSHIYLDIFPSGEDETYFITDRIKQLIKQGTDPSEIAVIYKENRDAEEIVSTLNYLKIPYHLEAGDNVLSDPEIQKLINILKVLDYKNPPPELLFEIMHYKIFKISELEIFKLVHERRRGQTIIDAISKSKSKKIQNLFRIILECGREAAGNTFATSFRFILNRTGFLENLLKRKDSVHHLNRLNILYGEIKKVNLHDQKLNIARFLNYIEELNENNIIIPDREVDADFRGVNLLTAHRAKGLEFEHVFIIKLIDGHWGNKNKRELIKLPANLLHQTTNTTDNALEEERRLFYVALTRAKRNVYLSYAENYGDDGPSKESIPSMFVSELPSNLIEQVNNNPEHNLDKILKMKFAEVSWTPNANLKKYLTKITEDFKISATSFNSYLNCPQQFFLDHILRVPKAKDFYQSYGTAVHKALENLFLVYMRDGALPTKKTFINFYVAALDEEILTSEEYQRARTNGSEILNQYYDFYTDDFKKHGTPLACEYSFAHHNVKYGNIPITGKIDKIDLIDRVSNAVRITDYKTSKPKTLNELMGNTKNADLSYLHQAFFYKLLSESDPTFRWTIKEFVFDFISPEKDKFKRVIIPIEPKEYEKFKELLAKTYTEIKKLKYAKNFKVCKKGFECDYINFCRSTKKY